MPNRIRLATGAETQNLPIYTYIMPRTPYGAAPALVTGAGLLVTTIVSVRRKCGHVVIAGDGQGHTGKLQ